MYIIIADRHEKVERALQKCGFIPKDDQPQESQGTNDFEIEEVNLDLLEQKLQDKETLQLIYSYIQKDDEEYDF